VNRVFLLQIRSWVLVSMTAILAAAVAAFPLIILREPGGARAEVLADPSPAGGYTTVVHVQTGSRMRDLVEELERSHLTTGRALLPALERTAHSAVPFTLPRAGGAARYEGLFRPGRYRFEPGALRPLTGGQGDPRQAALNASLIARRLLESAADRYAYLAGLPRGDGSEGEAAGATAQDLGPYQVIILASIVEKEAVGGRGYEDVSAVFHRRLAGGTPLGSCPTLEYALGYHRPFLTQEDLSLDSPYNVYAQPGLPPTPICFFSDQALGAAVRPSSTSAFFFVFDWTSGRLLFSETYGEHLAKADQARRNYARLYGREALRARHPDKYYEP